MKKFYFIGTSFLAIFMLTSIIQLSAQEPPEIVLIQPNEAGIQWTIGQTYLISWTDNFNTPVDIKYSVDGGGWIYLGTVNAGSTWNWNTANYPALTTSSNYKIRVESQVVPNAYYDISENNFTLTTTPSGGTMIHVEQPSVPGIQWQAGTTKLISWTDDLIENVKIELWKFVNLPGQQFQQVGNTFAGLAGAQSLSGTTWDWAIPAIGANFEEGQYIIYVKSTATGSIIADFSDNLFQITATPSGGSNINLIQPTVTGIQWQKGTNHLISWSDDLVENVKVELWYDNVGTMTQYTATTTGLETATSIVGTTFDWAISATIPDGAYWIKVKSTVTAVEGISQHPFNIVTTPSGGAYVHVEQPDAAGIQWLRGTNHTIYWTDDLIENVNLKLMRLVGGVWTEDPGTTGLPQNVSGTSAIWPIPATAVATGNYRIKVVSTVNPAVFDLSDNAFAIVNTPSGGTFIQVNQPSVSGIQWQAGTTHLISWSDDLLENVKIELWKYVNLPGQQFQQIDNTVANLLNAQSLSGSTWAWTLPAIGGVLTEGNYIIYVKSTTTGSTLADFSDNMFAIVNSTPYGEMLVIQPNGGEQWIPGTTYLLSWTDNISENVKIELSEDGGLTYPQVLAASVPGSTWAWNTATIPPTGSTTGSQYRIKVSSTNGTATPFDESNANFSFIQSAGGTIDVLQPNGGEVWMYSTQHYISWIDDVTENMNIDLIKYDNLAGDNPVIIPIATNVPGSTHVWTINQAGIVYPWSYYKIKISNILGEAYGVGYSGYFTINPYVKMTVFPNPANQSITMNIGNSNSETYVVQLFNRFNSEVMQTTVNTGFSNEITMSTQDLPNGIYFLTVTSNDTRVSTKVIIQH